MKKYNCILWDFNGTIYDDIDASRESTNVLLAERGLEQIKSNEEWRSGFGFPMIDYYISLGFDFTVETYPDVADAWKKIYMAKSAESGLVTGAREIIEKFKDEGYSQSIISACEIVRLENTLDKFNITHYFDFIGGCGDNIAHNKLDIAEVWKKNNMNRAAVMIGDTAHDFQVAESIGADCILFSGGFQSHERLVACGCPVIDDLSSLCLYIN